MYYFSKAFEEAARKYQVDHYEHGAQGTYGKKSGSNYEITTCISSNLYNHRNFWYVIFSLTLLNYH